VVQMVVRDMIELRLETIFSNNSYGYRPDKSPIEAVSQAKRMCWEYDFVIDIDIKGFFDNINHELLMKAVEKHVEEKWIKLYIKRWLTAPVELPDGRLEEREKGVPQGGVVSPILSNLFLHYVMDKWLEINYPEIKYERFADDGIIHCRTEKEAEEIKFALEKRFNECELELHPEKTTIAYCKDSNRKQEYPIIAFTFLGFTFKGRRALTKKGKIFTSFLPAMSEKAKKKAGEKIREMNIRNRIEISFEELTKEINQYVRGIANYYGSFYKSAIYVILKRIDWLITRWIMKKYRKTKRSMRKWIKGIFKRDKDIFEHWKYITPNYALSLRTTRAV